MAIGLGWKEGRSVTDFHKSGAPLGGCSWLPVHLIFYCWILKKRFCSVLFPECLQTYIDLPPQPFCPAKSRSIASPAGCWLEQCQPLLSLRGVWKHLPITSPWAAPGKPSSSFACIFPIRVDSSFLNCRNCNTKVSLDGRPAADYCCSKQSQLGTFYASVIQFKHHSNFLIGI